MDLEVNLSERGSMAALRSGDVFNGKKDNNTSRNRRTPDSRAICELLPLQTYRKLGTEAFTVTRQLVTW